MNLVGGAGPSALLVAGQLGQDFFRGMRKRPVADVVKQSREPDEAPVLVVDIECVAELAGDMNDTKRVFEARMHGAGIHQMGHRQLPDSSETLKNRRIDNVTFTPFDSDETVDGITEVAV